MLCVKKVMRILKIKSFLREKKLVTKYGEILIFKITPLSPLRRKYKTEGQLTSLPRNKTMVYYVILYNFFLWWRVDQFQHMYIVYVCTVRVHTNAEHTHFINYKLTFKKKDNCITAMFVCADRCTLYSSVKQKL